MSLTHWTGRSTEDFLYKIAADFVQQIENYLSASGEGRAEFARRLGRSPGRISQVLNSPGNLTLRKIIEYARAAGKKVSVVAYDDGDTENAKGPINSQVFEQCWIQLGSPRDFFALSDNASSWCASLCTHEKWNELLNPATAKGNDVMMTFHGPSAGTIASNRAEDPFYKKGNRTYG